MHELWKDIEGYEGLYQVSTWGRIRSLYKGRIKILKPDVNEKGYLKVKLFAEGKGKNFRVNRLVASAFIPNLYDLPQVNHKDGNKQNNSYTNLEWTTDEINKKHARMLRKGIIDV